MPALYGDERFDIDDRVDDDMSISDQCDGDFPAPRLPLEVTAEELLIRFLNCQVGLSGNPELLDGENGEIELQDRLCLYFGFKPKSEEMRECLRFAQEYLVSKNQAPDSQLQLKMA